MAAPATRSAAPRLSSAWSKPPVACSAPENRADRPNYSNSQIKYVSPESQGINNKARVITKRCYGVKSSDTLSNRVILDLNRASEAVGRGIDELREIVSGLKAVFLAFCT